MKKFFYNAVFGAIALVSIVDIFQIDKIDEIKKDLVVNKNVPIESVENIHGGFNCVKNLNKFKNLNRVADSAKIALKHPDYSPVKINSIMTKLYR